MSEYTKMRTHRMAGAVIHSGPPSFTLRFGSREWYMEWHHYCGPTWLKRNGDVRDKQPGERDPFWFIAQIWFDQGARVVDGAGVWEMPPTRTRKLRHIHGKNYEYASDDATGSDIIERVEFVDDRYNDRDWLKFAKLSAPAPSADEVKK